MALLNCLRRLAGDVENDLVIGVPAFQYPVCLSRCREREHMADNGPHRPSAQQGRATLR